MAKHWIEAFCEAGLPNEWLYYIPHFIERDAVISTAAKAVLCARQWRMFDTEPDRREGRRLYVHALKQVQDCLSGSSEDIVAVTLLGRYEQAIGRDAQAMEFHLRGLTTLLLSRTFEHGMDEIAAAFLYMTKLHRLFQPLASGQPSAFESQFWLEIEHPQRFHSLSETSRLLKKLTNQCYIRIPRLVATLRNVRKTFETKEAIESSLTSSCLAMILQAMALVDTAAETQVLKNGVMATRAEFNDHVFRPGAFKFRTQQPLSDLIEYWEARLFVLNIARAFLDLISSEEIEAAELARERLSLTNINSEQEQIVYKILKSTTTFETSAKGRLSIPSALIAVWGALQRMRDVEPINQIEEWVFERCTKALSRWKEPCSRQDLDRVSDMFVGGPFEGLLSPDLQLALLYHKF